MKTWNDCELVRLNGKVVTENEEALKAYRQYIFGASQENVWYDQRVGMCFGPQQNYASAPKEYSFLAPRDRFVQNRIWGQSYIRRAFEPVLGGNYSTSSEGFYQTHSSLKKYRDKTILIVGAGPSTNAVDWESLPVDYTWSCNHFFLNDKLSKRKVDLFAVGNEVDTTPANRELNDYLKRFPESVACFETTNRPAAQMKDFKRRFPEQCFYAHTRYRSQIGAVPRLIVLASMLGCKSIYFVGMDGFPKQETEHAFQPGKKPKGSPCFAGAYDKFRRQYVVFWDYMVHTLAPHTEFQNLGEGVESNLTTDISRQEFPLRMFS